MYVYESKWKKKKNNLLTEKQFTSYFKNTDAICKAVCNMGTVSPENRKLLYQDYIYEAELKCMM